MNEAIELGVITTHIPPAKGYGGVAVSGGNLVRAWVAAGRRIALCSSDESLGGRLTRDEVAAACGATHVHLYRAQVFPRWGFGAGAPRAVWKTIAAAPAVYVNGIATWPATLGALLCAWLGRPFTVAVRGGLMAEHVDHIRRTKPHKWLFYRWLTMPSLRRARAIHCTSELERDGVAAFLGDGRRPPLAVIANGVELALSPAPPRASGPLTICYAGRISREKGINRLLRIWRGWRRDDERMIVAGSGEGRYFGEFQILARSDPTIDFRGYVEPAELRGLMASSDFVTLPSGIEVNDVRENFGNAVAEGLALGRPALVTRGLAWDALEPAGAGILFAPTDDDILRALNRARAVDRAACAAAPRRYAERHLSIAVTAEALWRVCHGLKGMDRP